jgi:hypothetical protein
MRLSKPARPFKLLSGLSGLRPNMAHTSSTMDQRCDKIMEVESNWYVCRDTKAELSRRYTGCTLLPFMAVTMKVQVEYISMSPKNKKIDKKGRIKKIKKIKDKKGRKDRPILGCAKNVLSFEGEGETRKRLSSLKDDSLQRLISLRAVPSPKCHT